MGRSADELPVMPINEKKTKQNKHRLTEPRKGRDLGPLHPSLPPTQHDQIKSRAERGRSRPCAKSSRCDASNVAHVSRDRCNEGRSSTRGGEKAAREEKYFKCSHCGEEFKFMYDFKVHSRIHVFQELVAGKDSHPPACRKQIWTCNECGKPFIRASHLYSHMKTHTGDKHYKCDACGKRFDYESSLKVHVAQNANNPDHEYTAGKESMTFPGSSAVETQQISNSLVANRKEKLLTSHYDETPVYSGEIEYWGSTAHGSFRESGCLPERHEWPMTSPVSPESLNDNLRFLRVTETPKTQQKTISQRIEKTNRKRKEFIFKILVENQIEKEALREKVARLQEQVNRLKHSIPDHRKISKGKPDAEGKDRRKRKGDVALEDNCMVTPRFRGENKLVHDDDATPRKRLKQEKVLEVEKTCRRQSCAVTHAGHWITKLRKKEDRCLFALQPKNEMQTQKDKSLVAWKHKWETPKGNTNPLIIQIHKSGTAAGKDEPLLAQKCRGVELTETSKSQINWKRKGRTEVEERRPAVVWKRKSETQSQTEDKFLSTLKRKRENMIKTQVSKRMRVHFHLESARVFSASRHECIKCGRAFRHESILNLHMEVHTDGKKYDCNICGERFSSSVILRRHRGKHTREEEKQYRITKFARIGSPPSLTTNTTREVHYRGDNRKARQWILYATSRKRLQLRELHEGQYKFPRKDNIKRFINRGNPRIREQTKRILKINLPTK
ncbi:uncharacterized protein LOC143038258 isoform X2 [Oratosquilla oratoria]|uniref:uncharacterized protein LOC143038258 isoform X2 n=1 Tax=Oratosquilla oratoria TaxID=337810 RepID=UPI003F77773D